MAGKSLGLGHRGWLGRPVNDTVLRLVATQQLTIRVDLDRR